MDSTRLHTHFKGELRSYCLQGKTAWRSRCSRISNLLSGSLPCVLVLNQCVDIIVGMKLKCKHTANLGQLKQITKVLHDIFAELHRCNVVLK